MTARPWFRSRVALCLVIGVWTLAVLAFGYHAGLNEPRGLPCCKDAQPAGQTVRFWRAV